MKRELSSTIFMYILGALIVIGFFFVLFMLVTNSVPENNKEVMYLLLGTLVASFSNVVQYFYGSSQGSREKTNMMSKNEKTT